MSVKVKESSVVGCFLWFLFGLFVWGSLFWVGGGGGATKRGTIKWDTEEFKMPAPRP